MRVTRRTATTFELELTMRDVLGNLEELTLQQGFDFPYDCFELLGIEKAHPTPRPDAPSAEILYFPHSA